MKTQSLFFLWFVTQLVSAGELPWIGVSFDTPSQEQREKTPLEREVGFLVDQVVPGGPLGEAGGKKGDIWWKFEDQILISKRQMVVLLRGKLPGDRVKIQFYREGKLQRLELTLKVRPRQNMIPVSMVQDRPAGSRILAKRDQIAKITLGEEELSLEREDGRWRFKIKTGETVVLSSLVGGQDLNEGVPAKWQGPFIILKQTLESSGDPSSAPGKRGVRYVTRSKSPKE